MKRRILLSTGLLALLAPADSGGSSRPGRTRACRHLDPGAADVIHRDGSRGHDYGNTPKGLLMIDTQGHYSLQIYDSLRPHYASGDRARGTATEYQANALGISTHFGTLQVDAATGVLTLTSKAPRSPTRMAATEAHLQAGR